MADLIFAVGCVSIVGGCYLVSPSLALIVGGALVAAVGMVFQSRG